MKKTFLKFFLAGSILLPFLFASCQSTSATSDVADESKTSVERPSKSTDRKGSVVEIKEELDYLTTNISYFQFDDLPELSNTIKNSIESDWTSFKANAETEWTKISSLNSDSTVAYPPFEYSVKSEVTYSGNIISVYIETYRFIGGAHGETFIKTLNYDTDTNKFLNITELTGYSYEELSDMSRKELYNKLISENKFEIEGERVSILTEMIDEGTAPMAGNFDKFTVEGNKLTIYFGQTTVAPYSDGIQKVEFNF